MLLDFSFSKTFPFYLGSRWRWKSLLIRIDPFHWTHKYTIHWLHFQCWPGWRAEYRHHISGFVLTKTLWRKLNTLLRSVTGMWEIALTRFNMHAVNFQREISAYKILELSLSICLDGKKLTSSTEWLFVGAVKTRHAVAVTLRRWASR